MLNKILVPSDFSSYADNALKTAAILAKKSEAEIHVLHVIPPPSAVLLAPEPGTVGNQWEDDYLQAVREIAENKLEKLLDKTDYPTEKMHFHVQNGNIAQCISNTAADMDLIVMGTQGTQPIAEIFIGSNAERVVRLAACPVLTVRDQPKNFILAKILLATDLHTVNHKSFEFLRGFQRMVDAHIHLVFVNSQFRFMSDEEIERRKVHLLADAKLENYSFHTTSALTEDAGILRMAQELDVDIITVLSHQRRGLAHFFLGSTSEDIVNHSHRPVLSLRAK